MKAKWISGARLTPRAPTSLGLTTQGPPCSKNGYVRERLDCCGSIGTDCGSIQIPLTPLHSQVVPELCGSCKIVRAALLCDSTCTSVTFPQVRKAPMRPKSTLIAFVMAVTLFAFLGMDFPKMPAPLAPPYAEASYGESILRLCVLALAASSNDVAARELRSVSGNHDDHETECWNGGAP